MTKVAPGSSANGVLRVGDVILAIGGEPLEEDGSVQLRGFERISFAAVWVSIALRLVVALRLSDGRVRTLEFARRPQQSIQRHLESLNSTKIRIRLSNNC